MAAIYPHVETDEVTPVEEAYHSCAPSGSLAGLGRRCPTPQEVLSVRHQNIALMVMTRQAVLPQIMAAAMTVTRAGREYQITLDRKIEGPDWNATAPSANFKILAFTKKMDAPSFSLPAGAPELGGACPAAAAGQPLIPVSRLRKLAPQITKYTGRKFDNPIKWLSDAVCSACYATTGNYAYTTKILNGLVVQEWTRRALADGSFVSTMVEAIHAAPYKSEPRHTRAQGYERYFRIHDSGDMASAAYLRAWQQIAGQFALDNPNGLPPTMFWAPTRMWAHPAIRKAVNTGGDVPNLTLRPSAYHINDRCPGRDQLGPGFANGSVVISKNRVEAAQRAGLYAWDCQAYAATAADDHTCLSAPDPEGRPGCRACWTRPELSINYTLHGSKHAD